MPNTISTNFRQKNIENLMNTIDNESVYFFFSNPEIWTSGDTSPDTPTDCLSLNTDSFNDMLYLKLANLANASFVIRNYRWISGARYQEYDDTADFSVLTSVYDDPDLSLTLRPFYVVTDQYHVYKCLYNNGNAISTVKPTSTSTGTPTALADGYIWKYMFTIPVAEVEKFYTSNWVPLKTLKSDDGTTQWDVQAAAIPGTINNIIIESGGSGYTPGSTGVIITGGKIGATGVTTVATATVGASGVVQSVSISEVGSYYSFAPTLSLSGGSTAAQLRAVVAPFDGHGSDPVMELGTSNIMLKTRISGDEGGVIVDENDYRQIGLILNPIFTDSYYTVGATGVYPSDEIKLNANHVVADTSATFYPTTGKNIMLVSGTGKGQIREITGLSGSIVSITPNWDTAPAADTKYGIIANSNVINQTLVFELSSPTGTFGQDNTVTQTATGASAKVVKHDTGSTPQKLYVTNVIGEFTDATSISDGSVTSDISSIIQPTLVRNLGKVLYLENRKPITRNVDQIEDIKVIVAN